MSSLEVRSLVLRRGGWTGRFSFEIASGEWVSIVGPSGSGKSSLLEMVAGFLSPDEGSVRVGGADVTNVAPARRGVGYVFQSNALFPHLTLERNLLLGLHDSALSRPQKRERVHDVVSSLRLPERFLRRYPGEVSGGELARFNLARTLLRPARILLLDEPFSALDEGLRLEMNALVRALHEERHLTTLCVTHHQEDALLFSDRVLVVKEGSIAAFLPPRELSLNPPSADVAEFLRTGSLYECDGMRYFLRPCDLAFSAAETAGFVQPRCIALERFRWSSAGTHDTVLDLDTGRVYRLPPAVNFEGRLYFDSARVPAFSL